ncbi:proton-conducting transporter membrane subunit [Acidiphilium acidophilum]|uniref:proton-conducting transporter transmembrane domain-containing protein n=1 Tax=Acidiphilium acidophilum TaxID=76588 RepID=UPI002E8E72D9|nr:proton-conducting transporter membrane subunit [Acidiphilium acidophilum]
MIGIATIVLIAAPALAILIMLVVPRPVLAEILNLFAATVAFGAALVIVIAAPAHGARFLDRYIIVDPLGAWVILCAAIVYLLASIYARGYMRTLDEDERLARFYQLFALFALTIFAAPLMNNPGVYWIAIEMTTVVSTFLVAFEQAPESIEAGWKYIIIVSAGITLALLGTVLFYWAGTFSLGPTYQMTWATLRHAAPHMNHTLLILSFLLVLVGFGTKVGLAPMHTWLPDAHSEGPAPVSAMLSGALLNAAMAGIVRYLAVLHRAALFAVPDQLLVVFGVTSLVVAALFIIRQRGVKRLMAYSSVEHMGIIAIGFGFGGPLGVAGAMYHMLNHSLNKSLMFFGAGNAMRSFGTKSMSRIRAFGTHFPVSGALWLAGAIAITGAPPFGLFASEITILRAGFGGIGLWAAIVMAVLLIVIFIGFLNHFRQMYFEAPDPDAPPPRRTSKWSIVPMWLALLPLLVFGLWWPRALWRDFQVVEHNIGAAVAAIPSAATAASPSAPAILRGPA